MKAFWRKLTGTTTRAISTLVVTVLIIAIPLLIFVPQCQAVRIADDAARLEREDNARRTLAQIMGGAVGLIVIWITWRRLQVAQEGQVTERFSRAIEHLGNDSLDVRLGGIYALERIARDSRQDHWPVMEILTAYVRERTRLYPPPVDQQPAADDQPLATDIQAVLTVLGRRQTNYDPQWQGLDLRYTNLRGANLDEAMLQRALLVGANLQRARFREANLEHAYLIEADLEGAFFVWAKLQGASFKDANLRGAELQQADLMLADLTRARLQGANFEEAKLPFANLEGANLQQAGLRSAKLPMSRLKGANLQQANFTQAGLQVVDLSEAIGLTSQQLVEAKGDEDTKLPPGVERPDHWPAEREDAE